MGDLKFEEFGDIWIFLLTVPGLLFNMVVGLGKFIFISLPLTLWAFVQWLIPTILDIPVILFKTARILVNSGFGLLKGIYNFFVTFDWSWNALNDFPSLPSHIKALLNLGGINQPFDYFAGSYGTAVKEFILPLPPILLVITSIPAGQMSTCSRSWTPQPPFPKTHAIWNTSLFPKRPNTKTTPSPSTSPAMGAP
ncbi:hypothetical protein N9O95_05375, partial [Alphaproteobacteria bacterium]|nr:hypothetical protein [Alphaproteobacteria bacterium]